MKRTIISTIVFAAFSGAHAQVAITGKAAMGFKATQAATTAASQASGFGVDKSEVNFAAQEEIDNNQRVSVRMTVQGLDRGGANDQGSTAGGVAGGDSVLTYVNRNIGAVEMGSVRTEAELSGTPSADGPVVDMDGKIFGARSNRDYISLTVPVGPVAFRAKYVEHKNGLGLGLGGTGSSGQRDVSVAVMYASGPTKLAGQYTSSDNKSNVAVTGTKDNLYALQGGYDLGFAKLGAGYI